MASTIQIITHILRAQITDGHLYVRYAVQIGKHMRKDWLLALSVGDRLKEGAKATIQTLEEAKQAIDEFLRENRRIDPGDAT